MVSESAKNKIVESDMLGEYYGSDHVPILLDINV